MVQSSKVLTVSYGTFSCTLEGFDDSFDMMKAIAEYFRDLAADDRYFGAEPPTPDADMLARIAEREVERRVEARLEKGNIVLRPSLAAPTDDAVLADVEDTAEVSDTTPSDVAVPDVAEQPSEDQAVADDEIAADAAEREPVVEAPVAPATDAGEAPAQTAASEPAPSPVQPAEQAAAPTPAPVSAEQPKEQPKMRVQTGRTLVIKPALKRPAAAPADQQTGASQTPQPATPLKETVAKAAPAAVAAVAATVASKAAAAPTEARAASVADKLSRIRAVVAKNDTVDHGFVEDQHADVLGDDVEDEEDMASISSLLAEQVEDEAQGAASEDAGDLVAGMVAGLSDLDDDTDLEEDLDETDTDTDIDLSGILEASDEGVAEDTAGVDAEPSDAAAQAQAADAPAEDDDLDSLLGTLDYDAADEDDAEDESLEDLTASDDDQWDTVDAFDLDDEDDDTLEFDDGFDQPAAAAAPAPAADQISLRRMKRADVPGGQGTPAPAAPAAASQDTEEDDLDRELAQLEAEIASAEAELAETDDALDLDSAWDDADDADDWDDAKPEPAKPSPLRLDSAWQDKDIEDRPARPTTAAVDEDDDWDDYDEEDAEEDRKWAEAEARIKAEQAAPDAAARAEDDDAFDDADDADDADADADEEGIFDDIPPAAAKSDLRVSDDMEATIDRLARESVRKTVKMTSPARVMLTENKLEESDTSVSRILSQTDEEMSEPEGNRRRSAIAHLRAAVAATRADRILGRKRDEEKEKDAYREDLNDVVRPRRPQPQGGEARSERPKPKAAPLQLVAEQRVDSAGQDRPTPPKPARVEAVRPRRPGMADMDDGFDDDDDNFADYAQKMGAHDLPELLEAAASYMAFVEGRDQFSRPQLMSKVRSAEAEESSREDRLRSFGQLLREGKIQKTRGGRFTASDDIGFRPRAAG